MSGFRDRVASGLRGILPLSCLMRAKGALWQDLSVSARTRFTPVHAASWSAQHEESPAHAAGTDQAKVVLYAIAHSSVSLGSCQALLRALIER